jgi:3-isopropylmalate dehydratase small subunit
MKIKGTVWKFGDNVNTDEIIPARYLNLTNPKALGVHCMEGIDAEFAGKVQEGDIIVAGKNFGCGSSREHAPWALKGCGVSCVIAESFARIFYRNCINIGLPIFESKEASQESAGNDKIEIEVKSGKIVNISRNKVYLAPPFPGFMQELINAGGLMEWIKKRQEQKR